MRPINLSNETVDKLYGEFLEKFKNEIANYGFSGGTSMTIKTNFEEVAKEKVIIKYTQEAFLRMQALVDFFDSEVAWYGLCERLGEKEFRVYGVKLCKQEVSGAKVDTSDEDTLEFFCSLTDDEAEHLHFQAHSHVKMSTGASGTDIQNQQDVVRNMGKSGFYIFQIWNKNNDINTYLYDLDNNVFYDRKDVMIVIEDSMGDLDDFIASVADLVVEKKTYPYQYGGNGYLGNYYNKSTETKTSKKTEKKEEDDEYDKVYLGDFYDGIHGYYDRSDW